MHGRLGDSFSRVLLSFRGLVVDLGALVLGVVVLTFGLGLSYGPRAAFFAEAFTGTKNSDVAAYAAATRARPTRAARVNWCLASFSSVSFRIFRGRDRSRTRCRFGDVR